jgi:hypothetical protein
MAITENITQRVSRAISLGGAKLPEPVEGSDSFRASQGWEMEGGEGEEGGVQLNPIARRASRAKSGAAAEEGGGGGGEGGGAGDDRSVQTHYDDEGNPYFEDIQTGRVSYSAPGGWYDDRKNDEWDASYDEQTRGHFFVNRRTRRTTWTAKDGTEVAVGRAGHLDDAEAGATVPGGGGVGAVEGGGGGRVVWDSVEDTNSGETYFVNRNTRATTWTDRRSEGKGWLQNE